MHNYVTKGLAVTMLTIATGSQFNASSSQWCCCGDPEPEYEPVTTSTYQAPQQIVIDETSILKPAAATRSRASSTSDIEPTNEFQRALLEKRKIGKITNTTWKVLADPAKAEFIKKAIDAETDPEAEFHIKVHNEKLCQMEISSKGAKRTLTIRFAPAH